MQSDGEGMKTYNTFGMLLVSVTVIVFVLFVGYSAGLESVQASAVVAGHAEYVPDAAGKPKWQWKELKGK